MSYIPIKGPNNIDTSASRAGEALRESKKFRRDLQIVGEEIVRAVKGSQRADSPYAADRKTIDHNRIHRSPTEDDWKTVPEPKQYPLANYELNKRKIDII
jgi:hypothetical protein